MYRNLLCTTLVALLFAPGLLAQSSTTAPGQATGNSGRLARLQSKAISQPFSSVAVGGGISAGGVNLQAAVNAASHFNIRGVGNFFKYTDNNITSNGFTASGTINLATAGVSVDYFPWANHGFRVSPGLQFLNQNGINATMVAAGGTSFTLNDATYYSSRTNPVAGTAGVDLHSNSVNPTITLGWGNMIPRNGGHWSFPVEVGAAYTGQPKVNMALTSGQVCSDPAGTLNCQNVVGDPTLNADLQAQIAKYQHDLDPLRFYPIISFGVSYSFGLKGR